MRVRRFRLRTGLSLGIPAVIATSVMVVMVPWQGSAATVANERVVAVASTSQEPETGSKPAIHAQPGEAPGVAVSPVPVEKLSGPSGEDAPDPFLVVDGGGDWWLFSTATDRANIPVWRSQDAGATWSFVGDALPTLPEESVENFGLVWGPSVIEVEPDHWVLYVTIFDDFTGRPCVAAATASSPAGPYVAGELARVTCDESMGGALDPSVTRDADGELWLVYKTDGNCCGQATTVRMQHLDDSGRYPRGTPVSLLASEPGWEEGVIEGPSMVQLSDGSWLLLFSGGRWDTSGYAMGLAACETAAGPCERIEASQEIHPAGAGSGAGGGELLEIAGSVWVVFHSWDGQPGARASARTASMQTLDSILAPAA